MCYGMSWSSGSPPVLVLGPDGSAGCVLDGQAVDVHGEPPEVAAHPGSASNMWAHTDRAPIIYTQQKQSVKQ